MNKINYQKELDRVIEKITGEGKVPKAAFACVLRPVFVILP